MIYKGSFCALITPFDNNKIDKKSYEKLINWQINNGINGLVPCGTTGESPTLSHSEHKEIVELAVEYSRGKVPVMAGTGSNSTSEAINLTKHAKDSGADSVLVVVPYYNKPTQNGLIKHYLSIADSVDIPIFIYNIPSRSVVDMTISTIVELSRHKNIIGIKDASNDLSRPQKIIQRLEGEKFVQLSGEDPTQLGYLAQGGDGIISVTANITPKLVSQLHQHWNNGEYNEARNIDKMLSPLHDVLFSETSPGPIKFAASQIGICKYELRLPLVGISSINEEKIISVLSSLSLNNME